MGEKSKHNSPRSRLEEVNQDGEVCVKDREYLLELINMSLKELYDVAYKQGFEDGMSFIADPKVNYG